MEGYLKKWTNIFQRWQSRFFVLNDHVLLYCDQQGGQIKGQIHLRVASISLMPEDPLRIIIFTGTTEIHLRASTIAEKINWVNALRNSQEQCLTQKNYRNELQGRGKKIYETLTDIWVTSAACTACWVKL